MKKNKLILIIALISSIYLISCKKDKSNSGNSEYEIPLKTYVTDGASTQTQKNILHHIEAKLKSIINNTDDQAVIRERAVIEKYKYDNTIKIGIASSWTKNITDAHDAIMLAFKELNEAGGINGAKVELIEADDLASTDTGTRVAYKLAEDKEICAVLGHAFSDITRPASLIYSYNGILMFSPISSAHSITRQKDSMIFRNVQDDTEAGQSAAAFCLEKGWKNIAIIYVDVTFAESMANAFELECGSNGVTIVTRDSFTFDQTESEYKNLFKKWKINYKFDAVFVIGNMPQIGLIVDYLRKAGINQPIIGSDSFDDPRLEGIFAVTENERLYAVTPFNSGSTNPEYISFVKKFKAEYGHEPDQEGVQWYDAFKVLTKAIEKAGSPSPKAITEVLRSNTWSEAAGPYTFDNYGNVVGKPLVIKELIDGKYQIIR